MSSSTSWWGHKNKNVKNFVEAYVIPLYTLNVKTSNKSESCDPCLGQ